MTHRAAVVLAVALDAAGCSGSSRPLVGGADNDLIAPYNAQWLDGRFFVTGANGPFDDLAGPAKGLVLESGDRVNRTGSLKSMDALETAFAQKIGGVGIVDGAVIVWATDEAAAYVTTDLVSWTPEPIG